MQNNNNTKIIWLIFGGDGWIGSQVCKLLEETDNVVIKATSRADNEEDVEKEILTVNPDRIISLIGRTSGPGYNTIDYLEQKGKLKENVRDNLYSPLLLAILCNKYNIHFTYLGTGCIFNGYDHQYEENEKPDFFGSSYSVVKGFTDRLMHQFKVLNIRIRMPIIGEEHPKNFITKIVNYKKICSMPNSMTVLPDLLPKMIDLAKNKAIGTINLTNPGIISHNEILEMYKELVDPDFKWNNFSVEEQNKILLAERSNNQLNTKTLSELYPDVLNIHESVRNILTSWNKI